MISPKAASLTGSSRAGPASQAESLRKLRARTAKTGRRAELRPKLVLASASPRRMQLLAQVGIAPDALRPASIDESARKGEAPRSLVKRLAAAKAEVARDQIQDDKELADAFVLAADTVVAVGRRVLQKPQFVEQAVAALQLLSGRSHRVYTAVHLITPDDKVRSRIVETRVRFKRLTPQEIDSYIASREWRDKAGGYAIQGIAGAFVEKLVGSYTNVVGLPVTDIVSMLVGEGFPVYFNWLKHGERDLG
ncbi:MAG: Maf-like protein [Rhizobiales bacterium]|nr:Maf-like protein [Hyphomicrobiales bacterium]